MSAAIATAANQVESAVATLVAAISVAGSHVITHQEGPEERRHSPLVPALCACRFSLPPLKTSQSHRWSFR